MRLLLICVYILLSSCASVPQQQEIDRDTLLMQELEPMLQTVIATVGDHKLVVMPFLTERTNVEPRMGAYIRPIIVRELGKSKVRIVDRENLSGIMQERMIQQGSVLKNLDKLGEMEDAEYALCSTVRPFPTKYEVMMRIERISDLKILKQETYIIHKSSLPYREGGL